MGQYRIPKLNSLLQQEIATLISRGEVKDPRVSTFVTITKVEVAKDLAYAKVWVSTFLSTQQLDLAVEGLNNARGFIQSTIAKKLRIRQFPKLQFLVDSGIAQGFKMVEKLTEMENADNVGKLNNNTKGNL